MAHDVFVSHSSKDKPTADAVCAMLESQGIRCWVAPRDITPGMDWGEAIVHAVKGARVMVLVFSASANESPQIKREVERAVNKGIPVIPLRIEDVAPTASLEYFISTPHWLDAFPPPLEGHLRYLAQIIQQILGTPRATDASAPVVSLSGPRRTPEIPAQNQAQSADTKARRAAPPIGLLAGAVALLAVLLAGWWFGVERPRREQTAELRALLAANQTRIQTAATNSSVSSAAPDTNPVISNPVISNSSPPIVGVVIVPVAPTNPVVVISPAPSNSTVRTNPFPGDQVVVNPSVPTNPPVVNLSAAVDPGAIEPPVNSNSSVTPPPAPANPPPSSPIPPSGPPAMFALLKEANRLVNENCRENLVETRSEKSVGGDVVPSTWHLIFYNPTAKFKATEVIFQRGKMISKTDPWRMLEIFRADKVLPKEKLKMDSDVALRIARTNQLLEGVTLKMSEMKLDLQDGVPIWQIQLWAAKNRNPRDTADLGKIFISAENGQVIKNELQPNRIY